MHTHTQQLKNTKCIRNVVYGVQLGCASNERIDDEWCNDLDDFYIGEGFISTLLYQFRLFYEKWYLENKINESLSELVSEVELV